MHTQLWNIKPQEFPDEFLKWVKTQIALARGEEIHEIDEINDDSCEDFKEDASPEAIMERTKYDVSMLEMDENPAAIVNYLTFDEQPWYRDTYPSEFMSWVEKTIAKYSESIWLEPVKWVHDGDDANEYLIDERCNVYDPETRSMIGVYVSEIDQIDLFEASESDTDSTESEIDECE